MISNDKEPWQVEQARAFQQKQHLDRLPTFSEKLHYLIDVFGSPYGGPNYLEGVNAPFGLQVKPSTDEEREMYHRAFLDYHRDDLAKKGEIVRERGDSERGSIAFIIQPIDVLKADLKNRLAKAAGPETQKALLLLEFEKTTKSIDATPLGCAADSLDNYKLARQLREDLTGYIPHDSILRDEDRAVHFICVLAHFWDILHYEHFLKERIDQLESQKANYGDISSQPNRSLQSDTGNKQDVSIENTISTPGLTNRQKMLIHCYKEGSPYLRGTKEYNDYRRYQTPTKRQSYPNDSPHKANRLILDIEKIITYLPENARQQAEKEIDTIRSKFS